MPNYAKTTREKVFDYICDYKKENDGNSPTVREIKRGCGLSSESVVSYHLDILQCEGKIRRWPHTWRRVEVVGGKWVGPRG